MPHLGPHDHVISVGAGLVCIAFKACALIQHEAQPSVPATGPGITYPPEIVSVQWCGISPASA